LEFLAMLRYGADEAEAVDHFVADEIGVVAADFAVVQIVVFAAVFYEGGQCGRKFFGMVFGDEVHHVVGNQGGKPADVLAGGFQILGSPDGRSGHDFDLAELAAGLFCALAYEAEAPVDEIGVRKLENYPVADAAGGAQGPRRILSVLAAMSVRSGKGSFQMTWESKIQPKEKPQVSA